MTAHRYSKYTSHADDWRIYAYTKSPERTKKWKRGPVSGTGLIKVGESQAGTNARRIVSQNKTASGVDPKIESLILEEEILTPTGRWFGDKAVHKILTDANVRRVTT